MVVKLFFLPGAKDDIEARRQYAKEALANVADVLGVDKFDTLILSLAGVFVEQDEEDYTSKELPVGEKTRQAWVDTWKVVKLINFI